MYEWWWRSRLRLRIIGSVIRSSVVLLFDLILILVCIFRALHTNSLLLALSIIQWLLLRNSAPTLRLPGTFLLILEISIPIVTSSSLLSIFERISGALSLSQTSIVWRSPISGHNLLTLDVFTLIEISRLQLEFQSFSSSTVWVAACRAIVAWVPQFLA